MGQAAYNAGWRQWTGSVAGFRSVWVAGFASLWVAGLSSIRTALPRNHLPRSPLVTLPLAGQRPVTPPLPVSAALADGPMLAAGVPMRSVRPTYRTSSASYGNETHRASRRGGDERPAPIHAFRGEPFSLSIPDLSSPSPHSYCPGVDTLSRRSCRANRRGGGIPMTTAAARIALAVHWLGFGSAPITAVTFGMEFTTFRSPRRQRGEYRSTSFSDAATYPLLLVARRTRK